MSRSENPANRRMLLLRATDRGKELVARLRERRTSYLSEVLQRMSLDELTTLARGIAAFVRATDAQERDIQDQTSG